MEGLSEMVRLLIEASNTRQEIAYLQARNGNAPKYLHEQADRAEIDAQEIADRLEEGNV